MKKGFALFITLFVIVLFSILSLDYFQNKSFFHQLDTLKALDLQSEKYLFEIQAYYTAHKTLDDFSIIDKNFDINITRKDDFIEIIVSSKNHPIRKYLTLQP